MAAVRPCPVPPDALLARYDTGGGYADAYVVDVPGIISFETFVEAFYASGPLKPELFAVGLLFRKPSSDREARRLARGETDAFSAWRVEDRTADQILMREIISDKTRSWLMARPVPDAAVLTTRLHFGSAVLPAGANPDGTPRMSPFFAPMLGVHRAYSRVLLAGAARALRP